MKEWKIVIGVPGKIIVGDIRVESNMVDARTHSILNRKISSRSSGDELSLGGFMKLKDVTVSEHNNREYRETGKFKEFLFRKSDIFFVYDESQPKNISYDEPAAPSSDLVQKKTHVFEMTTRTVGNSYYRITGMFTGFLKYFEDSDFVQLKNVSITEYLKREDGFLKLKYDRKSYVSVNTKVLESVTETGENS